MLALAVAWVLFVPAADWLAHHDVGSATGPLHESALDSARGRLLTLGAGLFAAGALVFTARNFTLSRRTVELSRRTLELTEQGQVTDRYTKAIEQLGSDKLDVRIGGIYALERIARDSARDHPTVIEVLAAFIREHSHEPWPQPDHPASREQKPSTRPDVQAAVTVIGRRDKERDMGRIDLTGARLTRANLVEADLGRANLSEADLTDANLIGADLTAARLDRATLTGANLAETDLTRVSLSHADLARASLQQADLAEAYLAGADLTGAFLTGANLTHANLTQANLTKAGLDEANLTRSKLTRANLTDADLTDADLSDATLHRTNLTGAWWSNANTPVPEGWELDTRSDRLKREGSGTKPSEAN